jgi:hypothetical protein
MDGVLPRHCVAAVITVKILTTTKTNRVKDSLKMVDILAVLLSWLSGYVIHLAVTSSIWLLPTQCDVPQPQLKTLGLIF